MRKQITITVSVEEILRALKKTHPTSMLTIPRICRVECGCQEVKSDDFSKQITIIGYKTWKIK